MNALPDLPEAALRTRNALVDDLTTLIETATDEELRYIADADPDAPPARVRKQEAALRTIIFKRHGRMTEKHVELAGEVLSLVAEDGDEHVDRAFEIATAIMMINALLSDDHDGAMALCWAENGPVYARAAPDFRGPILSGFRWLADHATDWEFPHEPGAVAPVPLPGEIMSLAERAASGADRAGAPPG